MVICGGEVDTSRDCPKRPRPVRHRRDRDDFDDKLGMGERRDPDHFRRPPLNFLCVTSSNVSSSRLRRAGLKTTPTAISSSLQSAFGAKCSNVDDPTEPPF
jgi:hypothetical protein